MPTASQFRSAAARLAIVRDELAELLRPVFAASDGLTLDGPHRVALGTTLDVTSANVLTALGRLQTQIDESLRRAVVCERWSTQLRQYLQSDDPYARRPLRPASWVSYE